VGVRSARPWESRKGEAPVSHGLHKLLWSGEQLAIHTTVTWFHKSLWSGEQLAIHITVTWFMEFRCLLMIWSLKSCWKSFSAFSWIHCSFYHASCHSFSSFDYSFIDILFRPGAWICSHPRLHQGGNSGFPKSQQNNSRMWEENFPLPPRSLHRFFSWKLPCIPDASPFTLLFVVEDWRPNLGWVTYLIWWKSYLTDVKN
jgi:hypothetical protein